MNFWRSMALVIDMYIFGTLKKAKYNSQYCHHTLVENTQRCRIVHAYTM